MKIIALIKYLLVIVGLIFIFINWKMAIGLFLLATIFHIIPLGVNALLGAVAGYLIIGGIISLFINWKISVVLILFAYLAIKFRIWGNKVNEKYQQEEVDKKVMTKKPNAYTNEIGQSFTDEDMLKAASYAGDLLRDGKTPIEEVFTRASEKYGVPKSVLHSLIKIDL